MNRQTHVFGPAYLDRVLRVDRALVDPEDGPPLDQSVDGRWKFGSGLTISDPLGHSIVVELPDDWPGPTGQVELASPLGGGKFQGRREARGCSWLDDLGGMGSGFAAVLHGELISALGSEVDLTSQSVTRLLESHGIAHRPIRVPDKQADWTLL